MRKWLPEYLFVLVGTLTVVGLLLYGCSQNLKPEVETVKPELHSINMLASNGTSVSLYEVDSCYYVVNISGGIVHASNCPNHGKEVR